LRVHNREGAGGEVKRYRLHDLLRRLDDEREEPTTRRAHEVLEPYCRQKQDIPEAIYHANRLDWQRGVAEWVETFDRALELSQYDSCRALLELREVLYVGSYFRWGLIFQSEGDYYAQLAQHQAAEREYLEAIAAYSRALELAPDYINAHNNRGNALQSLGDLQASLSQTDSALASYQNAIAAYSRALSLAPNYVYALNNFGLVLIKLRQLLLENSQEAEAAECLKRTLEAFNRSLEIAPGNDYIRNLRDQLSR
jgi:tetratricopeptide (TPR) repeat protein